MRLSLPRKTSLAILTLMLLCGRDSRGQQPVATRSDDADTRLKYMLASLGQFEVFFGDDDTPGAELVPRPALRWTNTISNTYDGMVGVYARDEGRPEVVVQFSLKGDKTWIHEFASTSLRPFRMQRAGQTVWRPEVAGVELRALEGGPRPADTEKKRLTQLRELARRFEVEDDFHPDYSKPEIETHPLRLMTTPLHRYGGKGDLLDGALFGLVVTTDPEALVMVELHQTADGPKWMYALAPMTVYGLRAELDDKLVWDRPEKRNWKFDEPYFVGLFR